MCTAMTWDVGAHYFGRTLDLHSSYGECVVVTPRRYPLEFSHMGRRETHHAMIGMALVEDGYPLYYEAANEKGLAMAGLNFPNSAHYPPAVEGKDNVAPYELISWILCQCDTVDQARVLLERLNPVGRSFREDMPLAPLHWLLADGRQCVAVEPLAGGLRVMDNPVGVLTNEPPLEFHLFHLNNHMGVSREDPVNRLSPALSLQPYCRGMGGLGLPGDLSSASRFVRGAFTRLNALPGGTEEEHITQFFHILGSVSQTSGCARAEGEHFERTVYTSCCNATRGIYYYTTYENRCITAVSLHDTPVDGAQLVRFPLRRSQVVRWEHDQV